MDLGAAAEVALELDQPLPGFEHRPAAMVEGLVLDLEASEGIDPTVQGEVMTDLWDGWHSFACGDVFGPLTEAEYAAEVAAAPADPFPLRGGEVCDRCTELAVVATEHVWRGAGVAALVGQGPGSGRSEVLLWCRAHWRACGLDVLASGGVVVGTRG